MNEEAKKEIERRENLTAQFISQYNEKRNLNEDPILRLGYAISELLQIVVWLRIEIERLDEKKIFPHPKFFPKCTCDHSKYIHMANTGMCCYNDRVNFTCDCMGYEESET